ncbi:MAG: hypothetical protein QOJ62_1867 [Actinomycetota bacterium]|jgi:hypothetical protein|nr:hypothetical protein [Actinomycetota bacterium]
MKRLFYLAVGAGVGVAAVRRVSKAAQKLTPSGLAGSASGAFSGLTDTVRGFLDDVRLGMAEREIELHDALSGDDSDSSDRARRNGRSA